MAIGTTDDDQKRRELRSDLIRAGWPDASTYTQGFRHADKIRAVQVHEAFLEELADLCMTGWIDKERLLILGPCARANLPRAMNLVGMIQSEEGGDDPVAPIAGFWDWPTLRTEPVRVDENGDLIFETPEVD